MLTGVPQSGKDSLCLALVALAKENSKYVLVLDPCSSVDIFFINAVKLVTFFLP